MSKRLKGIIFDFNGVIVDDYEIQHRVWNAIAIKLRDVEIEADEFARNRGLSAKAFIRVLAQKPISDDEVSNLVNEKEKLTKEIFNNFSTLPFSPGVQELFNQINKHNIPSTIATSASPSMINYYFTKLNLSQWFDKRLIVCNDGTHNGKPEPDVYLLACKKLKLSPIKCIVFEDADAGIISAHKAGVGKIIAVGREDNLQRLRKLPGVNQTIHDFSEVIVASILS